jgi:CBS domain-containing protein
MKDRDVSSLIVVDAGGISQGLVTERDLVTKIRLMTRIQAQ